MTAYNLEKYLAQVAAIIREFGWISKTDSRKHDSPTSATCQFAWDMMSPVYGNSPVNRSIKERCVPTKEEETEAALAVMWVNDLTFDNKDHERDYIHKMKEVVVQRFVVPKNMAVAASIIHCYRKHRNTPTEKAMVAHGYYPKLKAFLDRCPEKARTPAKIVFRKAIVIQEKEYDLCIRRASEKSKNHGSYYLSDGLPPDMKGLLFGRISEQAYFYPASEFANVPFCLDQMLQLLEDSPASCIAAYGRDHKYCPLCDKDSTALSSVIGYSGECAKRYDLPWGKKFANSIGKPGEFDAQAFDLPHDPSPIAISPI